MKNLALRASALALLAAPCPQALAQAPAAAAPAPVRELTAAQWQADLDFMAAEMERRHKNLYHKVSRERFRAAVAELRGRIPKLSRNRIVVGMMRIAAMVGDGHTNVSPLKDTAFGFRSLPLKLYLFDDGLYVRAAAPDHADLVGARIEAIGGVAVAEAIRRVGEISPRDNDFTPKLYAPIFLAMPDILEALELGRSAGEAVLTLSKGKRRWTATVPAGPVEPSWPPDTDISLAVREGWVDARSTPAPPLWLQAPLTYHRLIELPEHKALYVQLNMVANVNGQTLGQFGEKIRLRAEAINPRAIVLDLRLNRGGNGYLRSGLVRELIKAEDSDTRLFVLTGRGTFSASQFILEDLDRLTDAVFVGEPAASKPNSYGDSYKSALPNSGLLVRSSIYYWQAGQSDRAWTPVQIAAPLTFAAYAAGRDPALEAALSWAPGPSLAEQLVAAAKAGGTRRMMETLVAYDRAGTHRYADTELLLGEAGQSLGWAKLYDEAAALLEEGVRRYPESANLTTVLAFVNDWAGRGETAREWGRRTLALDPNNRIVRPILERPKPPAR